MDGRGESMRREGKGKERPGATGQNKGYSRRIGKKTRLVFSVMAEKTGLALLGGVSEPENPVLSMA